MATAKHYVCVHGHFYQPPRENPWLETVETQTAAAPYHDWNERICAECYSANGAARIVNHKNQIIRIANNYARISFDFGPTLLSWMMERSPRTYRMLLDGERRSRKLHHGHSSAMAQAYNHVILPLANRRDRVTQIRWGIADYVRHFGAKPEGMWLPETAADSESLELLAQHGIKFTVLAPHQCKRIRPLKEVDGQWIDTPNGWVDTTRPYLMRFASGAALAVYFYDGPASRAIAFEGLLNSGDNFAARLKTGFRDGAQPQLAHVATDGESYGHHHKHGEMALAYMLRLIEQDKSVRLTNYGAFLEQFPPEYECQVEENTSWSCAHGVERWRSNCGCNGGRAGWNQLWREPLRAALDLLRDRVAQLTDREGSKFFTDVWAARDAYIRVILNRTPETVSGFLEDQQSRVLDSVDRVRALELMEMQRHTQLMYTSCGWFFDDLAGIETVQVIAYAARVLQLAQDLFPEETAELELDFLAALSKARSNDPEVGDGARIYREQVRKMQLGLAQVAAHYAIASVFSNYTEETELYCYRVRRLSYEIYTSGRARLAAGRAHVASAITGQERSFSFAVLHFGDQNITAAVKSYEPADAASFDAFTSRASDLVQRALFPDVIRLIDRYYGRVDYSLTSLFRDDQERIVKLILDSTLSDMESSLTSLYEDHASLLHFLSQAGLPKPPVLSLAAGFAINVGLSRALESEPIDQALLRSLLLLAKSDQVPLESASLSFHAGRRMTGAMLELQLSAGSLEVLDQALSMARTLVELPFELNLWQAQNIWCEILRSSPFALTALDAESRPRWEKSFRELGCRLSIDCEAILAEDPVASVPND
jgi:alpha-amylase/alpha-mannosidase (GH57 family)